MTIYFKLKLLLLIFIEKTCVLLIFKNKKNKKTFISSILLDYKDQLK